MIKWLLVFPLIWLVEGVARIFWTNQRAWRSKPMQTWMSLDTQLKLLFKDERTVHIGTHLSDPNILFQEFWGLFPFLLPSLTRRPDRGVWGKLLKVGKLWITTHLLCRTISGFHTKLGLMLIELRPLYFDASQESQGSCHCCKEQEQKQLLHLYFEILVKHYKKTTLKKGQDNRTVYITLTMLIAVDIVED